MAPRTSPGATRKQIFQFVRQRIRDGFPPTVREVQQAFGFQSVQTARQHLENLVQEGRLTKMGGVSRGYGLPSEWTTPLCAVPLLGMVQAGALTEAIEHAQGFINVETRGDETLFALRVRGRSMVNAGILPGDIVVVRQQVTAENGDIVVAMIDNEATVKRLRFVDGMPQLHPENEDFQPVIPALDEELQLLGRVIEVRRRLDE